MITDPALREEIQSHTGSSDATAGILRSIDRFGVDPSIQHYEMTPKASNTYVRSVKSVGWIVRAVRAQPT